MGTKLGLVLTAEGVETREHAERLRVLGCPLGQGYMLARPMPAEQAGALLADRLQARVALNEY
jgi:EAL domain-containing protein (putative c-di-GMP-specific phosphodiesterase class I)